MINTQDITDVYVPYIPSQSGGTVTWNGVTNKPDLVLTSTFTNYTGTTNIELNNIENDILELSGDTETVSRTIYVAITGDDITGTGLIDAPFGSVYKAFQNIKGLIPATITITIYVGAGTYIPNVNTLTELQNHKIDGFLYIIGDTLINYTGLTFTQSVTDRFIATTTGFITTPVDDALTEKFIWNPTTISGYPINMNSGSTIYNTNEWSNFVGSTEIREPASIWNMTSDLSSNFNIQGTGTINFKNIKFIYYFNNQRIGNDNLSGVLMYYQYCVFDLKQIVGTTQQYLNLGKKQDLSNCAIVATCGNMTDFKSIVLLGNMVHNVQMIRNSFRNTATSYTQVYWPFLRINSGTVDMQSNIVRNCGFGIQVQENAFCKHSRGQKFIDIGCAYRIYTGAAKITMTSPYYVSVTNTDYLFMSRYSDADIIINIDASVFNGTLNIANRVPTTGTILWKTKTLQNNVASIGNVCYNPLRGIMILLPNEYPEFSPVTIVASLSDNSSGTIAVGNITQNKSIRIDYEIDRGTSKQTGVITMTNKTGTDISDVKLFDDCGVTFTKSLVGNVITLGWATTNTGTAATLSYIITRIML